MGGTETILPLFPLPRTVLFPRASLPLYIFEPRYKEMIGRCIEGKLPFGILLLPADREGRTERDAASKIGGAGKIVWQRPAGAGGEMVILVEGTQRFRVLDFAEGKPYLQGRVEFLHQDWADPEEKQIHLRDLRKGLARTLRHRPPALTKVLADKGDIDDPSVLADIVVGTLPLDPEKKQAFLETLDPAVRVRRLNRILNKMGFLLATLDILGAEDPNHFARN